MHHRQTKKKPMKCLGNSIVTINSSVKTGYEESLNIAIFSNALLCVLIKFTVGSPPSFSNISGKSARKRTICLQLCETRSSNKNFPPSFFPRCMSKLTYFYQFHLHLDIIGLKGAQFTKKELHTCVRCMLLC